MRLLDIGIGTNIDIEVRSNTASDTNTLCLRSKVEDVVDKEHLIIGSPFRQGALYPLRIGTEIEITFIDIKYHNKIEMYKFNAVIEERFIQNNLNLLKIKKVTDIIRIQRRQFYRLNVLLPLKYRIVNSLTGRDDEGSPFIETNTIDLSGGGLCFYSKQKVSLYNNIQCILILPIDNPITIYGKVVRSEIFEAGGTTLYQIGVSYRKILNKDRETIINYIFKQQRKLRKKGLI